MQPRKSEQIKGLSQEAVGGGSRGSNAASLGHVDEQEEHEDDAGDQEVDAIREAGPAEDESSEFSADLGAAEMA